MKESDLMILVEGVAPAIETLIGKAMAQVLERMAAADRRVAELEAALKEAGIVIDAIGAKILEMPKPPSAEEVAALVQKSPTAEEVAALVPPALAGKDADPEVIAGMVKDGIAAFMTPLQRAVDDAITDVKANSDAATAEMKTAIAGLPAVPTAAEVAALVPTPKDGKDVDPEAVRAMVGEAVEALPKAIDGTSVTVDDIRPLVDEIVAVKVAELPPPKDGKDVDPVAVLDLVVAEVQKATSGIPMPKDGKDASPEAIVEAVEKVLATWERPKDGKSVTLEDVLPVLQERLDKAVAALPVAKDGVGLAGFLIDGDGVLFGTLTDGSLHKLGPVRGEDGKDGLSDGDFELVDGATEFTVRLVRGEQVKEWKIAKPTLADMHKGIWHEGSYKRGAVVTWGGSQWLALADTDAKPETTKDWTLVVKRGRDGKDNVPLEPKPKTPVKLG